MAGRSPTLAGLQNDNHLDSDVAEISLRSTLDELVHLLIPPSRLTIMDSSEVGSGKYGEVLLGTLDRSSQTPTSVAVKELRTVGTRGVRKRVALRLARELKIWAKVNHPHILQLVGYYLSDDYETARLISPFMTNGNVSQYLEKLQVGVLERMNIIRGITLGMDHLHSCNPPICHGDLKPANILMSDNLQAVLCDFGLASFVEESGISTGLTTSRSIKGSIRYMSPELLLEEDAKHTLESDIWAWGCTVFEIVTDCAPYNTVKGDRGLIMAFMREDPPGSTEILMSRLVDETSADAPPAFQSLPDCLINCWAFETEQRPRMPSILRRVFRITRTEETSRPPDTSTTDDEFEPTPPPPPTPPPTGQTPPDPRPSPLMSSVEGVPDLSDYIKKDNDAGRKWSGMSYTYIGHYKNPETEEQLPVALKLPREDATQTHFIREVKLWFGLKHHNINPLLGTFVSGLEHHNINPFNVSEPDIHTVSPWRQRGDVFSLLETRNLTSVDLRKILLGVSNALCYLHGAGYIHGDLKMEHVLLADDGEPLLTGFELSKGEMTPPLEGDEACSYAWAALEILMGGPKSKSGDVYAFGMMIIETLTWNRPFAAYKTAGPLMLAIIDGKRPERKEVIRELAPPYWESLWELAESCWPQAATARPPMLHVHGMLTRVMS